MQVEHLPLVNRSLGQTLTQQELSNIEVGLVKRATAENLMNVKFWGRLAGTQGDYVVALGLVQGDDYPTKKFFFCTNASPELQQLPELTGEQQEKASKITGRLTGDPSLPLEEVNEEEQEVFREVDRLAYVVKNIDAAVNIIPCGAYLMGTSHSVMQNKSFEGLSWEKAQQLSSYYHFRAATEPERQLVLKGNGMVRSDEFLDPITCDLQGSWSLTCDNTHSAIILRNLEYPGFVFFHKPATGVYGSAYFGDGMQNTDLAFML